VDAFLFQAEVGAISPVLDSPRGFQIVQRIDRDAGCLHIQLEGPDARARAQDLLLRLEGGADFSDLARQFSAEKDSAGRGGQWGMFQRSAADSLLRAACFQIPVGGVAAPIESPRGIHLIKRVPPQDIDPALADDVVARVRCILVAFDGAAFASPLVTRRHSQAEALARELAEKIRQGADMAELAREHDDDRGGRARAGDLGWIRRYSPTIPAFMDRVFSEPKGTLLGPIPSEVGWVLLRRER
jgi:peptidyl-prolyl cis-trans isomerase SurA